MAERRTHEGPEQGVDEAGISENTLMRTSIVPLAMTALVMLAGMFLYGWLGQIINPGASTWKLDFITTIFASLLATVVAYFVLRKQYGLLQKRTRQIAAHRHAEEALQEREEKYRTALESIEEGYFEVDLTGNLTFLNDSLCKIAGYPKHELLGMNNREYTTPETAKKMYQVFSQIYQTGKPVKVIDYEVIRKDGSSIVLEMSASLMKDSSGKPTGFRGILRDITEHKKAEEALRESEEKYRTILENIEDGYYEVDINGSLTFFNDSLCEIYGRSEDELMGRNLREFSGRESAKKGFEVFKTVHTTGKPARGSDWEITRKDGTKRYIEPSVSLVKDAGGRPIGFRGILRDITERKQTEEKIRKLLYSFGKVWTT